MLRGTRIGYHGLDTGRSLGLNTLDDVGRLLNVDLNLVSHCVVFFV